MRKFTTIAVLSLSMVLYSCEEILLVQDLTASTIELLAPAEGVVLDSLDNSFHWTALEGATHYHFQIATPGFAAPRQLVTDSTVTVNYYMQELLEGEYEWRVKAINSGYSTAFSSAAFRVERNEDFSDQQINLFSPSDNYLSKEKSITLEWEEIEEATLYRVQIIQNGQVLEEKTTMENSMTIAFPEGQSTWRVRAEIESRNTMFSERSILVDTVEPESPRLISPEDEAVLSLPDVTFEWERNNIPGSEEIDSIFVFKDLELSEMVLKERVTTSYSKTLNREETYYWFMRSYDIAGNRGEKSEVFSFTIE
jgi:hypothetical protein